MGDGVICLTCVPSEHDLSVPGCIVLCRCWQASGSACDICMCACMCGWPLMGWSFANAADAAEFSACCCLQYHVMATKHFLAHGKSPAGLHHACLLLQHLHASCDAHVWAPIKACCLIDSHVDTLPSPSKFCSIRPSASPRSAPAGRAY